MYGNKKLIGVCVGVWVLVWGSVVFREGCEVVVLRIGNFKY